MSEEVIRPPESAPTGQSPIADFTYRTYDGPLYTRRIRWWIVALAGIRLSMKKKGFWVLAGLAVLPYVITVVQLYLQSRASTLTGGQTPNPLNMPLPGQQYSSQFFQAFVFQAFFLFILTLLAGTGTIASDNQANALQVYLSKPITKGDYLAGKMMGVAIVIFAVAFVPALSLYAYCLLSFVNEGFFKNEPWLIVRIIAACSVPALVFSALIVGFSAWSKTPRMAGAIFAGFYFMSGIVAGIYWGVRYRGNLGQGNLERHFSVDGVIQGLVQNAYGVTQRMMTGNPRTGALEQVSMPPPNAWVMLALGLGLVALGLMAARARIRAVEVVRG